MTEQATIHSCKTANTMHRQKERKKQKGEDSVRRLTTTALRRIHSARGVLPPGSLKYFWAVIASGHLRITPTPFPTVLVIGCLWPGPFLPKWESGTLDVLSCLHWKTAPDHADSHLVSLGYVSPHSGRHTRELEASWHCPGRLAFFCITSRELLPPDCALAATSSGAQPPIP